MAKILITGGSGLIGKELSRALINDNHEVVWLSRTGGKSKGITKYEWNIYNDFIDPKAFKEVDYIVHLAGAGIVQKCWTKSYKKKIIDSRVKSSHLLYRYISEQKCSLKAFIGASAIGYYGSSISDHNFTETSPAGSDFMAEVCKAWENSYKNFEALKIRTCVLRTGVALGSYEGAYAKLKPIFNLGLGSVIATGQQFFPWIHVKDVSGVIKHCLFNTQTTGVYNLVASETLTNQEFSTQLAKSLNRPLFLPNIPEFVLKMILGERALTLTHGVKISNEKIKKDGYQFQFESMIQALSDLNK